MDLDRFKKSAYVLMAWVAAWSAMALLQYQLDLANLAMLLVLASAVSALWLPGWLSVVISALAVLAFNWFFVPPRFTFSVDHLQNALLLMAMLLVNWMIAGLMIRQRHLADVAGTLQLGIANAEQGFGMARWRERLFAAMSQNAGGVVEFFRLPGNAVVELGTRVCI